MTKTQWLAARAVDGITLAFAVLLVDEPNGLPRMAGYAAVLIGWVAGHYAIERRIL